MTLKTTMRKKKLIMKQYKINYYAAICFDQENIFIKRELMSDIYILGISYGKYIMSNNNYWFNAESQLKEICIINGIDFFSSVNELEDSSLYNYNKSNYYDIDNNLKDDKYSFFIKRN